MKRIFHGRTFSATAFMMLAMGSSNLFATPIPLGGGGVLNGANMTGGVVALTSNSPCIAFSGSSVCAGAVTGIGISGVDPIFGTSGTIKDIGTALPETAFKTANLTIGGGPAIFDLLGIQTPSGFPLCTFTTVSGACSTGTFVFVQVGSQVAISFTTNEVGYLGSSATGSSPYEGIFTAQLSGGLTQFGCVVSGAQTCTDTIANILIFQATAAQTTAAGLGAIGQSGTVRSSWSVTESPAAAVSTPEPFSFLMVGSGLAGVVLFARQARARASRRN